MRATYPVHHAELHFVALSSLGGGEANYEAHHYVILPATSFTPSWVQTFSLYSVLKHSKYVEEDSVLHDVVALYASRQHNMLFLKGRNIQ